MSSSIVLILVTILGTTFGFNEPKDVTVYRAHQLDVNGAPRGCRAPPLNLDATRITNGLDGISRKCVIIRISEISSSEQFEDMKNKAGGVLVVLPPSLVFDREREEILNEWESKLLEEQQIKIPFYFVHETKEISDMIQEIDSDLVAKSKQTLQESIVDSVFGNTHQLVVSAAPLAIKDPEVTVIESKFQVSDDLPTIILSSNYDSYSLAPELSFGGDSNAAGVIATIQIMKLLFKSFQDSKKVPKSNVLALISGGGKLNYFGSNKWLEMQESKIDSGLLSSVSLVLSLDSLSKNTDTLYAHMASSIKPESPMATFISQLENSTSLEIVSKKINLAEENLAWDHERFSSRRLPSMTLSSLAKHRSESRSSIFDTCDKVNLDNLNKRINSIFNALQVLVFGQVSKSDLSSAASLQPILGKLCSGARAQQLLSSSNSRIVNDIESMARRAARSTTVHKFKFERKSPEFTFYEPSKVTMTIFT